MNGTSNREDDTSKSMEDLFKRIEVEKQDRFQKTWSKLDKGSKLDRIHLFIKTEKIDKELNDSQEKKLKNLLLRLFESGILNKVSEVEYSTEKLQIIQIKNLSIEEGTNTYIFHSKAKKKVVNKSKSNVEKHFSRSKENKR